MSTVSILSTSSFLWRSWAGQRITRSQWIHGANGSFICSWIQGLIVKWRMILLVRQRFKIFPSEEYMAHFSHRRSGGNSQLRSKVGRNPERQRRLVWFLTRSITWARVIYIFYRSPERSIRTALFFFRGATRISLGYSNWSDWEECSVLLAFGAGAMVATTHPHHRLPILHGKGEIHVDLLRWMRVSLRYLGISPSYHTATNTNNIWLRSVFFFWFWHYCFCEDSQIARTSRRHVSSARRFDSLCDTPFHTVTIGVNVVSTECLRGFRYAVNFVDGYTSLHCLFMWTKNEVTTKLEEFISDF